jgi:23S rRNA (pseudouridine1915-N3)-methyltransferase
MKIKVVCVGRLKEKYLKKTCAEYLKRFSQYCNTQIIGVRDQRDDLPGRLKKKAKLCFLK